MIIVKKRSSNALQIVVLVVSVLAGVVVWPLVIRPWYLERRADQEMMKTPAFQQIAKWEPVAYKEMKTAAIAAMQRGESPARIQGSVRGILSRLVNKYIPQASDEALIEYMRVQLDEAEQVAARDPDVAFAMLFQNEVNVDLTKYVDEATQKRDAAALAEVIRSGITKDAGYQNDQRAKRNLQQVAEAFRQEYGPDAELVFTGGRRTVVDPSRTRIVLSQQNPWRTGGPGYTREPVTMLGPVGEKALTVEMTIAFYRRIFELRSDQSAQIIRLMLSKVGKT